MTRYTIRADVRREIPLTPWECEELFSTAAHAVRGYRWGTWSRRADHAIGRSPRQLTYAQFRLTVRVKADTLAAAHEDAQRLIAALAAHPLGVECRLFDVDTTLPGRR